MLVEPYMTGSEKLFEEIAITERIKATGPADENILPKR